MKRNDDGDVVRAFQRLASAGVFVNRAPRVKRIQSEWSSLLVRSPMRNWCSRSRIAPRQRTRTENSIKSKSISLLEEHTGTEV